MKRGETLSATARAERSRESTKASIARELLHAAILAWMWPAYITTCDPRKPNDAFPWILCVESPAGVLRWRLSSEERQFFDVRTQDWDGEQPVDRTAVLLALATDGSWTR